MTRSIAWSLSGSWASCLQTRYNDLHQQCEAWRLYRVGQKNCTPNSWQ